MLSAWFGAVDIVDVPYGSLALCAKEAEKWRDEP